MVYSKDYGYPVHRNCEHFNNGFCTLSATAVDPGKPACPRFTPKSTTETPHAEAAYPGARIYYQRYPPYMGQGHSLSRRGGRGRGRGNSIGGMRGMVSYPYRLSVQLQTTNTTVRAQENELKQQLEDLEKQLNEVRGKLKKLRYRKR